MKIVQLQVQSDGMLFVVTEDGRKGCFDVNPYLRYEAFAALRDPVEFAKVVNGGYFVEWECGADLSADTIEERWHVVDELSSRE